jgi:hypothetical protein
VIRIYFSIQSLMAIDGLLARITDEGQNQEPGQGQ